MIPFFSMSILLIIELYFTVLFTNQLSLAVISAGLCLVYLVLSCFVTKGHQSIRLMAVISYLTSILLTGYSRSWQYIVWCSVLSLHWFSWAYVYDQINSENQSHENTVNPLWRYLIYDGSFYGSFFIAYLFLADLNIRESMALRYHFPIAGAMIANYLFWESNHRYHPQTGRIPGMARSHIIIYLAVVLLTVSASFFVANNLRTHVASFVPKTALSIRGLLTGQKNEGFPKEPQISQGGVVSSNSIIGYSADSLRLPSRVNLLNSNQEDVFLRIEDASQHNVLNQDHIYLRGSTFTTFNGNSWTSNSQASQWIEDADDNKADHQITLDNKDLNPIRYKVYINNPEINHVLHIPNLAELNVSTMQRRNDDTYKFNIVGASRYSYTGASTHHRLSDIDPEEVEAGQLTQSEYMAFNNDELHRKVKNLASSITRGHSKLLDKIDALTKFMGNHYTYSLEIRNRRNRDPLENFLFYEKKGHCVMFATSFCLLLRSLDIPARVASGYCGGEYDANRNLYTFYSANSHVWTEVFMKDYGWIIVDPTPPYQIFSSLGGGIQLVDIDDIEDVNEVAPVSTLVDKLALNINFFLIIISLVALMTLTSFAIGGRVTARRQKAARKEANPLQNFPFFVLFCQKFESISPYQPWQTPKEYLLQLKRDQLITHEFDPMIDYLYLVNYHEEPRNPQKETEFETLLNGY